MIFVKIDIAKDKRDCFITKLRWKNSLQSIYHQK